MPLEGKRLCLSAMVTTTLTSTTTTTTTGAAAQKMFWCFGRGSCERLWVRDPNFSSGSGGETWVPYTNRVQLVAISEDSKDMMKASSKLGAYTMHIPSMSLGFQGDWVLRCRVWNMSCTTWLYSTANSYCHQSTSLLVLLVLLLLLLLFKSLWHGSFPTKLPLIITCNKQSSSKFKVNTSMPLGFWGDWVLPCSMQSLGFWKQRTQPPGNLWPF